MRYQVRHSTTYRSPNPVTMGYHQAHLSPRDTPGQRVVSHRVDITPAPSDRADHLDLYGNRFTYFSVEEPHDVFDVTATSEIEILKRRPLANPVPSWEAAAARATSDPMVGDFLACSPLIPPTLGAAEYAAPSFAPGRSLLECVGDLNHRIWVDFAYRPGWTTISTPLTDVLATRSGVCQDFAHLAIACMRSVGLAARYVSGYIENLPAGGQAALAGADASHAWASVCDAEGMWIDLDPTNGLVEPVSHITVAWGRDYSDVVPLKGVVTSVGGPTQMSVEVEVKRHPGAAERKGRSGRGDDALAPDSAA
ncbi:MAG: transglutaminase family protein [Acidimicrobiales bacterium]